jgi:hypothetical protein
MRGDPATRQAVQRSPELNGPLQPCKGQLVNALVRDESRIEPPARLGTWTAIKHEPAFEELNEKRRRPIPRGIHCSDSQESHAKLATICRHPSASSVRLRHLTVRIGTAPRFVKLSRQTYQPIGKRQRCSSPFRNFRWFVCRVLRSISAKHRRCRD